MEGWNLLDSLYFSVVTLTTIGYGDLSPSTAASKIFTIFYIFVGLVHLGENNPSASDLEWTAHIRPLERLGHRSVEVLDELEDAPVQILHGGEAAPLEEPARQNRVP